MFRFFRESFAFKTVSMQTHLFIFSTQARRLDLVCVKRFQKHSGCTVHMYPGFHLNDKVVDNYFVQCREVVPVQINFQHKSSKLWGTHDLEKVNLPLKPNQKGYRVVTWMFCKIGILFRNVCKCTIHLNMYIKIRLCIRTDLYPKKC
jgi:hypothetical protein